MQQRLDTSTIMTTTMKTMQDNILVYHIGPNDVLLGRGSPIVNHKGNKTFMKVVNSRKAEYMGTSLNGIKDQIAHEVMNTIIRKTGGRFLRKKDDDISKEPRSLGISVIDKECAVWVIVDECEALQKVKQALRERGRPKKMSDIAVKCQKPIYDTINMKTDDNRSIEILQKENTLPTSNVTNEQQQPELHHHDGANISTNRLSYEDLLVTSARLQLEKQSLMSELLKRRQFEIDNEVGIGLTPFYRSNNMMVANNSYHWSNNYLRPQAVATNTQMMSLDDHNNSLFQKIQLQNQDTTTMISDIFKKKNMDNFDLLYGCQRNRAIDTTTSLVNDRLSLLSNNLSYFVPQQQQTDVVAKTTTTNKNGLNSMMNHYNIMNNNSSSIGIELLILKKKREIYHDMLLANCQSFTTSNRKRSKNR